ncbi:DNA-binding transcriptional regulator, GntR family [Promicromonospora umidemergens]|uniref:GntR family transcriptional regulator n=1 Tax=Promicromonospora umidemergens TaxID=629679 RepID=A0ABP8WF37_9MICO|nr:GntR family transcriptional regulator [Promicromonospora umidemergens]MCP2286589.1 DNA-binding transcriptional regulator, GntR family [Promicromonospora umidemergens]
MSHPSRATLTTAPSFSRVTRPSTVDLIQTELRNAVYAGVLAVGSPIREVEVAAQLGVSRGPLREAAQRLVQEGLLAATPGRGMRVATISKERLPALYEARKSVEVSAARLLVRSGADTAIAGVRRAHDELVAANRTGDARRVGGADLNLHWALVAAAGNPWLTRWMTTLIVEVRLATFTVSDEYVVRKDTADAHALIVERLEARDEDGLVNAITQMLEGAVDRLLGREDEAVETFEEPADAPEITLGPIDAPDGASIG